MTMVGGPNSVKIIQISDTHLSPYEVAFHRQLGACLPTGSRRPAPDLVIHTGDLTIDGADHLEDITFADGTDGVRLPSPSADGAGQP
ncbi:metallophosphoesterase [Ensifer canadensis]